jgi:hypothetical protein
MKLPRFQFRLRTPMTGVTLLAVPSDSDMERFRAAFPEAQLARFTSGRFMR